ncbi:MAG: hypothetical protein QXD43_02880 [Candidatus Aenigmatarchaeota archaeon]
MKELTDIKLFNLVKKFNEYENEKVIRSRMSVSLVLGLDNSEINYCEYLNKKVPQYFCNGCNINCSEKQRRTGD